MEKKENKIKPLNVIVFFAFLFFIVYQCVDSSNEESKLNADGTPKTERQIEIENQFSVWDGSHKGLTDLIQEKMNNPDSYEHIETKFIDNVDYLLVTTEFRGENSFGGMVVNTVSAKVDLEGNILEIIGDE